MTDKEEKREWLRVGRALRRCTPERREHIKRNFLAAFVSAELGSERKRRKSEPSTFLPSEQAERKADQEAKRIWRGVVTRARRR